MKKPFVLVFLYLSIISGLCQSVSMSEQELMPPSMAAPMSREDSLRQVFKFQTDKDEIYDRNADWVQISNNQMREEHAK